MSKGLTRKELLFIWKTISALQGYLGNHIECGAEGCNEDYDNGTKARKLIQRERLRLKNSKPQTV